MSVIRKFIDIGANLTDPMFTGVYHGSKKHASDLKAVLDRSWKNGVNKMIITGGNLEDSQAAISLAENDDKLFSTVGCHPTRCNDFEKSGDPNQYLHSLSELIEKNRHKVVAIGECGLDYDRLEFCPKEVQKKYFEMQLSLSKSFKLPLFLHCRNAADDLMDILNRHNDELYGGVVHSFDGTSSDALAFINMGYYIGLNGCSLKTENNLQVVSSLPVNKIMIETDCPWCEVRPTHAGYKFVKTNFPAVKKEKWVEGSMVKSRNEPSNIIQVLEVIAGVRQEGIDSLCDTIYSNTEELFFSK